MNLINLSDITFRLYQYAVEKGLSTNTIKYLEGLHDAVFAISLHINA